MTLAERKVKAKALEKLLGDFIEIRLKTMTNMETTHDEMLKMSNHMAGYVIDIDECFIYLGEDPSGFTEMIDLDEVGTVSVKEDIPEELLTIVKADDSVH